MSVQTPRLNFAARRAELLAELFFQELDPVFLSRPTPDVGYDLIVGFSNEKAGINTFAVDVKSTKEPPPGLRFPISRSAFDRLAYSNVPGLLLVADVKKNQLYYGWFKPTDAKSAVQTISIPLIEIDENTKRKLKREFQKAGGSVRSAV